MGMGVCKCLRGWLPWMQCDSKRFCFWPNRRSKALMAAEHRKRKRRIWRS